ncbi:hypothetical protein [Lysinibacillus telephonicus]|uniref:hypothetical protein n=1 Tax=Lysinibacillus telephonicus TaxID=1714840 RepID=UPI0037CF2C17
MKVYLWAHIEGVYLLNEDLSMWSKPYFIKQPQRILLLKERFKEGMDNIDLLCTINNEELQQLVKNSVINWKPLLPFMKYADIELFGFAENYIATAEYEETRLTLV